MNTQPSNLESDAVNAQESQLITLKYVSTLKQLILTVQSTYNCTHAGNFCMVLRTIVMLATQHCSMGHACGISYCLQCVALPCLLLSLMFVALLYMYDVTHCIHVYLLTLYVLPTQDGYDYKHSAEATYMEEDFSF